MGEVRVHQSAELPNGKGRVVVFDWSGNERYRLKNLVCFDANDNVIWIA